MAPAQPTKPSVERRRADRYPVEGRVSYRTTQESVAPGIGWSANLSSTGLLFHAADRLPQGIGIEVSLRWRERSHPICLHITGQVVRAQGSLTAVRIDRSEFRAQDRLSPLDVIAVG